MQADNKAAFPWFICGTVVGAAVALLIAPAPGEQTRKRVIEQASRGRKSLLDSGQEIFDKGRDLYERGREIAEEAAEMFERGRQIAEKTVDDRI